MILKVDAAVVNCFDVCSLAVSDGLASRARFAGDPITDGKCSGWVGFVGVSAGEGGSAFACGTSAFESPRWIFVGR